MTPRVRLALSVTAVVADGLLAAGVTHLTGGRLNTSRWRGHAIVVNFWGSWCVSCRKEAPVLARVAGDTRFLGVRFLGVDIREDPFAGLAFERHYGIGYPSISDPGDLIAARFGAAAPVATRPPTSSTPGGGSPGPGSARPATASSISR